MQEVSAAVGSAEVEELAFNAIATTLNQNE